MNGSRLFANSWRVVLLFWFLNTGLVVTLYAQAQTLPTGLFTEARVAAGLEQSKARCATCHLYPEPTVLDRETWQSHVLPWMMMISGLSPELLPKGREGELIKQSGGVLLSPGIPKEEWWNIVAYYLKSAPMSLDTSGPPRLSIATELKGFKARALPLKSADPMALLVQINEKEKRLYVGDGQRRALEVFSAKGETLASLPLNSVPVSLRVGNDGLYVTDIGRFSPSQEARGSLLFFEGSGTNWAAARPLLPELTRPVHASFADMNGDGRQDVVVSMFGWYGGRLSWFANTGGGAYAEHELHPKPGALRTEIRDLNGDGKPDIAALFAQATEGMIFFFNRGDGEFESRIIIQKHPAFGHTYFEMADFDGDGKPDLLVTNGDNGDYESPPKPYHGIRIYLNRGGDKFEEKVFIPLHGACKAVARDFDRDGDLDIAVISYYPDYRNAPRESFVLLENEGSFRFSASTFPNGTDGRWLTMDAGDLDGDGDVDIVLGAVRKGPGRSAYVPVALDTAWRQSGLTVMLLENFASTNALKKLP